MSEAPEPEEAEVAFVTELLTTTDMTHARWLAERLKDRLQQIIPIVADLPAISERQDFIDVFEETQDELNRAVSAAARLHALLERLRTNKQT